MSSREVSLYEVQLNKIESLRRAPDRNSREVEWSSPDSPVGVSKNNRGEIEIFLSYKGEIRPCCFIGVDLDKYSLGGYNEQLKEIFNFDCNLNSNDLKSILDFFDKKIKDKWNDTFENGKCIKCSMTCGASSQIDHSRLYENIKI